MNLHELFLSEKDAIRSGWIHELQRVSGNLAGRVSQADLMKRADEMVELLVQALKASGDTTVGTVDFAVLDRFFDEFARDRVEQGFNSEETATFVFTLKRPLFERIQARSGGDAKAVAQLSWDAAELVDRLGLRAVGAFQRMRESIIERQQHELLELSTPVVKLWKDVLALPIIGTLDSNRTQIMMETLLTRIAETEASIAIIDITGVPTVDTLVAQHLIKTVTAIRLMGADCIISGVRPQIAQTIVHLGVDLGEVTTKANLADALALALKRTGVRVLNTGENA